MPRLNEIHSLMIDKWNPLIPCSSSFNHAIDQMGNRSVGIDREKLAVKLAKEIASSWIKYFELFGQVPHGTEEQILALLELGTLDAIIANESEIICYVKE